MTRYIGLAMVAVLAASVWVIACGDDDSPTTPVSPFVKASDWVAGADWNTATEVVLNMVENGPALSYSPSNLTFEAGKPYILRVVNPPGNVSKHYFSTEGMSLDFYKSIATRKIQTADA